MEKIWKENKIKVVNYIYPIFQFAVHKPSVVAIKEK